MLFPAIPCQFLIIVFEIELGTLNVKNVIFFKFWIKWVCACVWRDFGILAGSKRVREEDNEENRPESLHTTSTIKKSRLDPAPSLQVNIFLT